METMQNYQAGPADFFIQTVAAKMSKVFIETIQEQGFNPAIVDVGTLQKAIISEYMKNILCCVYDRVDYDNIRHTIDIMEYVRLVAYGRTLMRERTDYSDRCFLIYLNLLVGDFFGQYKLADGFDAQRSNIVSEVVRITPFIAMKTKFELSKAYYQKFGTGNEVKQLEANFEKLKLLYDEKFFTGKSETNDGAK